MNHFWKFEEDCYEMKNKIVNRSQNYEDSEDLKKNLSFYRFSSKTLIKCYIYFEIVNVQSFVILIQCKNLSQNAIFYIALQVESI